MNSPREMSGHDYFADSDATYFSEAENTNLEGCSNLPGASNIKRSDTYNDEYQLPKECLINLNPTIKVDVNQEIHENIVTGSVSEQSSNLQAVGLKNITPIHTEVNTHALSDKSESEDIIPIFQTTLSFPKHSDLLKSGRIPYSQRAQVTQKNLHRKKYRGQNRILSHSEPIQVLHERDHHIGTRIFNVFYNETLEQQRVKMKAHCQSLTSRLYDIKNEVSSCIIGSGPKLSKVKVGSLFEEVKVLRKLLRQIFDTSKRLVSYVGGKSPLKPTKYSAADQTCEKLLVQLNPETFREDFTPLRELYDSDQEGFFHHDQMVCDGTSFPQTDEDENPEIMEVQEDDSPSCSTKISKSVRFQSPLTNYESHTHAETFNSSRRLGSVNDRQNVILYPSALKNTNCEGKDLNKGEILSIGVPSTSLNEVDMFVSDDDVTSVGDSSEVTSSEVEPTTCDMHVTTNQTTRVVSTARAQANFLTDERTSSPKVIITDTASSMTDRSSQPQLHDEKNNDIRSPQVLENSQSKTQAIHDPNKFQKDSMINRRIIVIHPPQCRESNGTCQPQTPQVLIHSLNRKTIILAPAQTNKYGIDQMNKQENQHGNVRGIPPIRVETLPQINAKTNRPEMIDNQNDAHTSQSFDHTAHKRSEATSSDFTQESAIISKFPAQNKEVKWQGSCLTYLEPSINQITHNSGSIHNDPVQEKVTNEVPASQSTFQTSQSSDIDMHDFNGFSSDEETQMPCSQPFSESANISSSERNNRNTPSLPQDTPSTSKWVLSSKELSTRASDVSLEIDCDKYPRETKNQTVPVSELSNRVQPPGWCNIFEQHKQKKTLPNLTELMIAGMISPGEMVLSLKGSSVKATLLKNAKILTSEGATFHSPMAWCSAWHEGKTVSRTLAYHRVYYKGEALMDICQKAFKTAVEEIASAVKEKKKRECPADVPAAINAARETQELHAVTLTCNDIEIVNEAQGEGPKDFIIGIHSLLVHNDDEYTGESYQSDFWEKGVLPVENFQFIDQW